MRSLAPLLLLLAASCRPSALDAASRADTPEAYRTFLRQHPDHDEAGAVRARLAELEFAQASRLHTLVAYKRFLEEFPDSAQAAAARALLEGLRFNAAREGGPAALRHFLRDHPDGAHRPEAEALLFEAARRELVTHSDLEQLRRIAAEAPGTERGSEALARLDRQAFAEAKASGARALLAYLREFPAGAHREQAQALLLSIQLEGLLFSGLFEEAREKARSPLAGRLPALEPRLKKAEAEAAVLASREPLAQAAHYRHYLRPVEDLEQALAAPDPLERWQAAEELGQQVSVRAIDPLLGALRGSRNTLVRRKALDGLRALFQALPKEVAELELGSRLEALRPRAEDAEVHLAVAVLLDLLGRLAEAPAEYQKAFDPGAPDPVLLWRWAELRLDRGQHFSAAVAARQLSRWALEVARAEEAPAPAVALLSARRLCAAVAAARFSLEAIGEARRHPTEFPDDLQQFERGAVEALRLAEARLRDAELALRTTDPAARSCDDREVAARLAEGEKARAEALRSLPSKLPRLAPLLLELARERDPSPAIRELAARLSQPKKR